MNPYAALLLAAVLCGGASADTLKSIVEDSGVKGGAEALRFVFYNRISAW